MSSPIRLLDGSIVYQACGDVVLIKDNIVTVNHYGIFLSKVDQAARASLSKVELEADELRRKQL